MLFRKPLGERTVAENLRKCKTGGLRRRSLDKPFPEVIPSGRTPRRATAISDHPCLPPQHFMRIIVRAMLPLGEGTVLDPFMDSGLTIAAAEAVSYRSVGIEIDKDYFRLAETSFPKLVALYPPFQGDELEFDSSNYPQEAVEESQLTIGLAEPPARHGIRRRCSRRYDSLVGGIGIPERKTSTPFRPATGRIQVLLLVCSYKVIIPA
jgi:hypothetical protein